ncbi:MAG: D-2-hydroxyacid dehydrogenase [Eubacteriales bacterium]
MIISLNKSETSYIPEMEKLLGERIYEFYERSETLKKLSEADIIVTFGGGQRSIPFDEEVLAACKNLKLVCSVTAGVEDLPLDKLHEKGVKICNSRGAQGGSIAEYVMACMLVLSHNYHILFRNQPNHQWGPLLPGEDLIGKTLCVVGTGAIGKIIGQKSKAMDMRVIGVDKYPMPFSAFEKIYGMDKLYEALKQSDFVVLAAPLTEETFHMMGLKEFQVMKKTGVFINISRGDTTDEQALIHVLQERQIAGAILDVFHEEPLPKDSPLWSMENVLVTPHAAGPTKNTTLKVAQILCDNIIRYRNGEEIINAFK